MSARVLMTFGTGCAMGRAMSYDLATCRFVRFFCVVVGVKKGKSE